MALREQHQKTSVVSTTPPLSDFEQKVKDLGRDLIELIIQKNRAYGGSFSVAPAIMKLLYPKGITVDQIDDALYIVRVIDKIKRIAEKNDPFGENPAQDIGGYSLLKCASDAIQLAASEVVPERKVVIEIQKDPEFFGREIVESHPCFDSSASLCHCDALPVHHYHQDEALIKISRFDDRHYVVGYHQGQDEQTEKPDSSYPDAAERLRVQDNDVQF